MKYNIFSYTFKIWLTTAVASTTIFTGILFFKHTEHLSDIMNEAQNSMLIYVLMTIAELTFSLITWIAFSVAVFVITTMPLNVLFRTWIITIIGVLFTIATFVVTLRFTYGVGIADLTGMMICNCICIAVCTWLYKLEPIKQENKLLPGDELFYL